MHRFFAYVGVAALSALVMLFICAGWCRDAHGANLPSMCGDATHPTGCTQLSWGAIDFTEPDAPTPCAAGFFVAGVSAAGAFDCQLGGSGAVDCAGAPTLTCLAGRTGTTNDPTVSSDADGTIRGSAASGFALHLGSDNGTPGVHIQRNVFGLDRLLMGPGVDPTAVLVPGGVLQFLVTGEGTPVLFGAHSASVQDPPAFVGLRSQGTLLAPTTTLDGDPLLDILGLGYDTGNVPTFGGPAPASMRMVQEGNAGSGFVPGRIDFKTTDTAGNDAVRLAIHADTGVDIRSALALHRTAVNDTAYSVVATDLIVAYTALSAGRTVTLDTPTSSEIGRTLVVKDESGGAAANNITIATLGAEVIDGAATATINTNYGSTRLYTDGTNWFTF